MHIPVLLNETLDILNPKNSNLYVDATFGGGGYTKSILEKSLCNVLAVDCDQTAAIYGDKVKKNYPGRFNFINDNFKNIDVILKKRDVSIIDGIIFDLGVSSMQLDNKQRGFSFRGDGPLDMRMDSTLPITAKELINSMYEGELANLIFKFGGERKSRLIAKNIVKFRQKKNIKSTLQLVEAMGIKGYNDKIHFATRTFQALRITVNSELENLKLSLEKLPSLLAPNAIIVIITFHSLEDKIVKDFFNSCSREKKFKKINKKVIRPTYDEIKRNPRARSAKLRGLRKVQ